MGQCISTAKVGPESPEEQIKHLLEEYQKAVDLFLEKAPHRLTTKMFHQHKSMHLKFNKLIKNVPGVIETNLFARQFDTINKEFADGLVTLYEENELTIDEDLRKMEQMQKLFNLPAS